MISKALSKAIKTPINRSMSRHRLWSDNVKNHCGKGNRTTITCNTCKQYLPTISIMERDILFREVTATTANKVNGSLPLNFELSPQEVATYQKLIKPGIKTNRDANALTNKLFFDQLHPELKGRKLKPTDKEYIKNQWLDLYYQVVLPLLGISKQRPGFVYPAHVKQTIDSINERFSKMFDLVSAI